MTRRLEKHRRLGEECVRFALVGTLGFAVDAAVLYIGMDLFDLGPYVGRLVSYLVAATLTWACHRNFTFADQRNRPPQQQWAMFVAVNALGAGINYGVYVSILSLITFGSLTPFIGVVCGSISAMIFNFSASRTFVFSAARRA